MNLDFVSNIDSRVKLRIRGGPFDTWGLWFFFVIKLFSTPSLNVQFFQTLSKANNFFSQQSNQKLSAIYFICLSAHHFNFLNYHHIDLDFPP